MRSAHLNQGNSLPIRACNRNINQGLSQSGSLAFSGSIEGAMKSIIGTQVLVLCVDVLPLLAWLVLTTRSCQVDVVGVKTKKKRRQRFFFLKRQFLRQRGEFWVKTRRRSSQLVIKRFWNIQDLGVGPVWDGKIRHQWF